mmetsp:Transcript_29165/g.44049  ORF Transcript_29165/g.44049 Transcript_29165/m.44049 type:complete len:249 (+) Transcript_29165:20-766(+)|eukprot:CAMPEP_0206581006 /NCGR_PEP_ID=MMETSP0325_2-20121206/33543_1 /ASSEMBLY_ACC=CAM_ASM_000347 /TAXON_ID=2866 /ORGANISM="Crypthecodinium cohnii, Strain Seligo" /LENGTH=248 /DNA_ID=CAMNT_0054087237 /DNA_START=20 /DNA_END=766 /DNA_ORIENTATION=-
MPLFTGASKSIEDLEAVGSLVDHANKVTKTDFAEVSRLLQQVKETRSLLEHDLAEWRTEFEPACHTYAQTRRRLLSGENGQPSLAKTVLVAQGKINDILRLGHQVGGCVDTCEYPGGINAPTITCARGNCKQKLAETAKLEELVSKKYWHDRDTEVVDGCSLEGDHELEVDPPAGFATEDDQQDEWGQVKEQVAKSEVPLGLLWFAPAMLATEPLRGNVGEPIPPTMANAMRTRRSQLDAAFSFSEFL